ncbi:MAG: hypothetical protein FRX49_00059 [Trebouxia sp. A1-2]|nr:MAG: hypothetical protein FRX49_00059 [Trebouxia sp. A1-2]
MVTPSRLSRVVHIRGVDPVQWQKGGAPHLVPRQHFYYFGGHSVVVYHYMEELVAPRHLYSCVQVFVINGVLQAATLLVNLPVLGELFTLLIQLSKTLLQLCNLYSLAQQALVSSCMKLAEGLGECAETYFFSVHLHAVNAQQQIMGSMNCQL